MRSSIEKFGYGHLDRDLVTKEQAEQLAAEHKTIAELGEFSYYIIADKKAAIQFGNKPSKKELKEILKHERKATTGT